jgi:hypothetical protein
MGYLTTFTVYNDGIDLVKKNAQDFADKIHNAATSYEPCEIPLGSFANLIRVQKCRHADDHTLYVHMGNTVFEMNPNSAETQKMMKNNPKFFEKALDYLNNQVKELNEMLKNSKVEFYDEDDDPKGFWAS